MYPDQGRRLTARARQFLTMDNDGSGTITLSEWIDFCMFHILGKISRLPKDCLGGSSKDVTMEDFITFVHKAVDKTSPEYRELYFFLLKTFQAGDKERKGRVTPEAFDLMIEAAAAAPRRFGLAPRSETMFKTDEVSENVKL